MNRTHLLALAFAILLAVPITLAVLPPLVPTMPSTPGAASFETLWKTYGWQAVGAVAVIISMTIVSLAYMLGVAFRQPQITAWAKNELYQALMTAFMFAFIVGFVYFLANITSQSACLFSTTGTCESQYHNVCDALISKNQPCEFHIQKAWSIANTLEQKTVKQADVLLNVNNRAAMLASIGKYFDLSFSGLTPVLTYPWYTCWGEPETCSSGAAGFGFTYYAGVSMLLEAIGLVFPVLFTWITSFVAQAAFLVLVRDAIFPIFLTLGLILRTFFFTRKLGGLLIAIAIGVYTIYPFMYILFEDNYNFTMWEDKYDGWWCKCNGHSDATDEELMHCPARLCSGSMVDIIIFGRALVSNIGVEPPVTGGVHPSDFLLVGTGTDPSLMQITGLLMVPGVVIPLLALLVTVAFIKGLSPLLGGDVEIAGLTHLI